MKRISLRRKTPSYIEEIEVEISRNIILRDGSKEIAVELDNSEEEQSIIQQFEQLQIEAENKGRTLLQKIKEILPLPRR